MQCAEYNFLLDYVSIGNSILGQIIGVAGCSWMKDMQITTVIITWRGFHSYNVLLFNWCSLQAQKIDCLTDLFYYCRIIQNWNARVLLMDVKQKRENAITCVFTDYCKECNGTETSRWKYCEWIPGRKNLADNNFLCVRVYLNPSTTLHKYW